MVKETNRGRIKERRLQWQRQRQREPNFEQSSASSITYDKTKSALSMQINSEKCNDPFTLVTRRPKAETKSYNLLVEVFWCDFHYIPKKKKF